MTKSKKTGKDNRKPNHRGRFNQSRDSETDNKVESSTNDPAWYMANPALLQGAANLYLSNAAGLPVNRDIRKVVPSYTGTITQQVWSAPGILAYGIIPCPSGRKTSADALNVAATSLYSFVRHANSGSANYDSPDLMLYCIAMGQIYSYLNFCARVYGTARLYSFENRYFPRALVTAQNVDYDDLIANLAEFRYRLNSMIFKASSLAVPADMSYFKRLAFLFSGIYAEGESVRDQLYLAYPTDFLQFSETGLQHGGSLQRVRFKNSGDDNPLKVDTIFSIGEEMLNRIIVSEDMNIMSGDILKAFQGNILKLATVDENFMVVPTTDLNVLEQFQNADIFTEYTLNASITQDPDTGYLWPAVFMVGDANNADGNLVAATMNSHVMTTILTEPKPEDIVERTRYMANIIPPGASADTSNSWVLDCGTEVVKRVNICVMRTDNGQPGFQKVNRINTLNTSNTATMAEYCTQALNVHCLLENFKFHPTVYYANYDGGSSIDFFNAAVDLDNYAIISSDTLSNINDQAKLALFNVPQIARFK